jgi:tetratricopeptide (TPR) repeat protein
MQRAMTPGSDAAPDIIAGPAFAALGMLLQVLLICGDCLAADSLVDDLAVPNAASQQIVELTALGHEQFEQHDLRAAQASFARAVELGETRLDPSAMELFEPLRGLAQVLFATQQYPAADATLRRAINIVRHDGGLYDPRQLAALTTLAESQAIGGQREDAEGSLSYLERISSNTFGPHSVRHAVMLTEIGRSYCQLGNTPEGRQKFRLATQLLESPLASDTQRITALRGIAECCMYDVAAYGISTAPASLHGFHGQVVGSGITAASPTFRTNVLKLLRYEGEHGLTRAARLALKSGSVPMDVRIGVLLQTGDWFQIKDHVRTARDYYAQAHRLSVVAAEKSGSDADRTLSPDRVSWEPVQLLYATPPLALRQRGTAVAAEKYVVVEFTVRSDGRVQNEKVVDRDASKSMVDETMAALRTARYRPRLVAGKPEHTELVQYRQTFFDIK